MCWGQGGGSSEWLAVAWTPSEFPTLSMRTPRPLVPRVLVVCSPEGASGGAGAALAPGLSRASMELGGSFYPGSPTGSPLLAPALCLQLVLPGHVLVSTETTLSGHPHSLVLQVQRVSAQ